MAIGNNNARNLQTQGVTRIILPRLRLRPIPDKVLKIVPDLKDWAAGVQGDFDDYQKQLQNAINGNIS